MDKWELERVITDIMVGDGGWLTSENIRACAEDHLGHGLNRSRVHARLDSMADHGIAERKQERECGRLVNYYRIQVVL